MISTDLNIFRKVLKEELKPINEKLDAHGKILENHGKILENHGKILENHGKILNAQGKKLNILWDQVERVTISLVGIEEKLDSHSAVLKRIEQKVDRNFDDTGKLDKRLIFVEHHLGIVAPPELKLVR